MSFEMRMLNALMSVALDLLSYYYDVTRFSKATICTPANFKCSSLGTNVTRALVTLDFVLLAAFLTEGVDKYSSSSGTELRNTQLKWVSATIGLYFVVMGWLYFNQRDQVNRKDKPEPPKPWLSARGRGWLAALSLFNNIFLSMQAVMVVNSEWSVVDPNVFVKWNESVDPRSKQSYIERNPLRMIASGLSSARPAEGWFMKKLKAWIIGDSVRAWWTVKALENTESVVGAFSFIAPIIVGMYYAATQFDVKPEDYGLSDRF
jgi:hypothetical protein